MTKETYQVGDVAPWCEVRPGSLVRHIDEDGDAICDLRIAECGWCVWASDMPETWETYHDPGWPWHLGEPRVGDERVGVTIIALDVPADATAEHLRTLAEVFEVREAWEKLPFTVNEAAVQYCGTQCGSKAETAFFVRLHRAGWRPGMTAEDAARLLAEQETACRQ